MFEPDAASKNSTNCPKVGLTNENARVLPMSIFRAARTLEYRLAKNPGKDSNFKDDSDSGKVDSFYLVSYYQMNGLMIDRSSAKWLIFSKSIPLSKINLSIQQNQVGSMTDRYALCQMIYSKMFKSLTSMVL